MEAEAEIAFSEDDFQGPSRAPRAGIWDTTAMGKASALNLTELSRDEKLELIDRLWESLGQDPEALPLTISQREELDRRLDELETEGPIGLSWDEVVAQARARSR